MAASIRFDQVGIPASASTGARTDGVPGAVVTVTNDSGAPCRCEFVWVPPDDTTVLASLTQNSPSEWEFTPQADRHGSYAIRMIEAEGTDAQTVDTRVFGIRLPGSGLLVPAFNERGDATVSLADTTTRKALAASVSWNNEQNPEGINWAAWWQAQRELYEYVEGLGGTIAGYDTAAALRAVAPASGEVERTYGGLTAGDGKGGLWLGITGQPLATYTHDGEFVLVPVGGDGTAAWVRFSDDVLFLSPDALPSVVDDIDIGRHIQTTDGYTWEVVAIGSNVDNVGTVRTGATKAALRQYSGPLDVRWFGAVGDGVADDAVAVQAAVDAAGVVGGKVFIPTGVFRCTVSITADDDDIDICGNGPSSVLFNDGDNLPCVVVLGDRCSFDALTIRGNNSGLGDPSALAGGDGLSIAGDRCSVNRVRFENLGSGPTGPVPNPGTCVIRTSSVTNLYLTVTNCFFDSTCTSHTGADILGHRYLTVRDCKSISNMDQFVNSWDTSNSKHIITGNHVKRVVETHHSRHGILLTYTGEILETVVSNNIIENCYWTAIYVQATKPPDEGIGKLVISDNVFINCGGGDVSGGLNASIFMYGVQRFTCTGNVVIDGGYEQSDGLARPSSCPGILASSCRWGTVSNNAVSGCLGPNIELRGTATAIRDVVCSGNSIVGSKSGEDLSLNTTNDSAVVVGAENIVISNNSITVQEDDGTGLVTRGSNNTSGGVTMRGVQVLGNSVSNDGAAGANKGILVGANSMQGCVVSKNVVSDFVEGIKVSSKIGVLTTEQAVSVETNVTIGCTTAVDSALSQAVIFDHVDVGSTAVFGADTFGTHKRRTVDLYHNAQTGTSYTLAELDQFAEDISFSNASPVAVTVPDDSTFDFPIGTKLPVYAGGAGKVTFAGESVATIESVDGYLSLRTQGSAGTLWKRGANDWVLIGDLAA